MIRLVSWNIAHRVAAWAGVRDIGADISPQWTNGDQTADFVFASTTLAGRINVQADNDPENWGPSDHCRVIIEVDL